MALRDHGLAAALFGGVMACCAALLGITLLRADLPPEASGRVMAFYPWGWSREATLAAAFHSEARLVRESWLGNGLILQSDEPGLSGRLRQSGAIAVWPAAGFETFSFAGCTGLPNPRLLDFKSRARVGAS